MTFRIHATAAALEDVVAIGRWISSQGPSAEAQRWVESLFKALWSLAEMPERCSLAPEDEEFEDEIRHLIIGDYRALFTVRVGVVFILHVRHGRRLHATFEELDRALKETERASASD